MTRKSVVSGCFSFFRDCCKERLYETVGSFVGGSETEAYTLDFSLTSNYSILGDTGEPNENVQEAAVLTLGNSGANVSGILNTAIV